MRESGIGYFMPRATRWQQVRERRGVHVVRHE